MSSQSNISALCTQWMHLLVTLTWGRWSTCCCPTRCSWPGNWPLCRTAAETPPPGESHSHGTSWNRLWEWVITFHLLSIKCRTLFSQKLSSRFGWFILHSADYYWYLCFSSGREGSTQQASVSELLLGVEEGDRVGGEDRRIFWVQLFCLRCWDSGCVGGCWGCLVSVGWGVSSLAGRSGLSNCAGGRRVMTEDMNLCRETSGSVPKFELEAEASSKYRIRRQHFDVSCKILFGMLLVYAAYKI